MNAELPSSVYYVLGALIFTNLGALVTIVGYVLKFVYNFAVLETKVNALHRRMDKGDDDGERDSMDN